MKSNRKNGIDGIKTTRKVQSRNTSHTQQTSSGSSVPIKKLHTVHRDTRKQSRKKPIKQIPVSQKPLRTSARRSFRVGSRGKKALRILVLAIAMCWFLFWLISQFDRTVLSLTPQQRSFALDENLRVSKYAKSSELAFNIIAITESKDITVVGSELQEIKEKASGTIRIFNDYSTSPQRLVEETRFESVDGKIFKLPKGDDVIVPGKEGETPGSIDVVVYADTPGEEYNIDLTDFSIPGFKELGLDEKYASMYALSVDAFTGGSIREEYVLSEDQKAQAEDTLRAELTAFLKERLTQEQTDEFIIVEGSERIDIYDLEYQSGDDREQTYVQSGRIFAVIVKKEDLQDFIAYQLQDLEREQTVSFVGIDQLSLAYRGEVLDYETLESLTIAALGDLQMIWNIDELRVAQSIAGIDKGEISPILDEFESVAQADIRIFPVWRNTASDQTKRIKTKLLF